MAEIFHCLQVIKLLRQKLHDINLNILTVTQKLVDGFKWQFFSLWLYFQSYLICTQLTLFSYLLNAESMIQSFDQYKESEHKLPYCLAGQTFRQSVLKEAKCRKPSLHLILLDRRLQHWRAHLGKHWKVRLEYRCSGAERAVPLNDFYDEICPLLTSLSVWSLYTLPSSSSLKVPPRVFTWSLCPLPPALPLGPPLACPFLWAACPPWLCQPGSADPSPLSAWPLHMALILQYCTCLPGTSSTATHVLYLIHSNILPPSIGLALLESWITLLNTPGQ